MTINFKTYSEVELIQYMGDDETVARAARVSTGKDLIEQGKIDGLVPHLGRSGHTSCFEHNVATFRLEVPLFVRDQIVRHRTGSYNILSLRYTEAEPSFYIPPLDRPLVNAGTSARPKLVPGTDEQVRVTQLAHRIACQTAWDNYQDMIKAGVANEVARNVLPASTFTAMWMTMDLNNWAQFLKKRNGDDGHPQGEIQKVAEEIQYALTNIWPIAMTGLI